MDTQLIPKLFPAFVTAAFLHMESSRNQTHHTTTTTTAATAATAATHVSAQGIEALKDIAFGSLAGSVGKIVEYPFDTVKVRLQSQPDHLPLRYAGPLDCFRQGLRQDGFRGLYRGVGAPMFGAAAETACLFWTYRVAQDFLRATGLAKGEGAKDKLPLPALMTAGAIAGGLTSLVLTPIELVKCRVQAPSHSLHQQPVGVCQVIADVYRHQGLRGFWRGQLGTLLRETGGGVAWFGSYEALTKYFQGQLKDPQTETIPIWQQMFSGAIAGMGYNFIFYPADTIKSKIQTGDLTNRRPNFMKCTVEMFKCHGLRGLYRGCGITVARSAPSSALIFTIYESLRKAFE